MRPDIDAASEAARACVQRYQVALEQTQGSLNTGWGQRLSAFQLLWEVLEDADALLQSFPEEGPRGEREALITLSEYWHDIEPVDTYWRMDVAPPKTPSLQDRAVSSYRNTAERIRA